MKTWHASIQIETNQHQCRRRAILSDRHINTQGGRNSEIYSVIGRRDGRLPDTKLR